MNRYLTAASLSTLAIAAIVGTTFAGVTTPPAPVAAQNPATSRAEESWPMPVETFLEGNYLKRSDIVLTRRDWDLTSWVIRWATGSPFSHAALIFTGPQFESGFSNTFVIEASTAGVDLTNLRDYIADKSSFLAVKRFKKEWFDEPKQSRVRGLLLDKIKADYNFWALGHIARNIWFGVERSMRGDKEAIQTFRERDWTPPNEYICSGLVQIGFVEAVLEYIKSDQLPPSALREVVFQRVAASRLPEKDDWQYLDPEASKTTANLFRNQNFDALESVTPEDLALSDKLEWLYMIKNGLVYKADSYDDVRKVIE
ncbi:MAG: YiiX/YebB-like N1pC/P60 family cysteine hydrolase [Alphaproteobacteria bacterium]